MDVEELKVLSDLVVEEIDRYPGYEHTAILRIIAIQQQVLAHNPVQLAYLLAYN